MIREYFDFRFPIAELLMGFDKIILDRMIFGQTRSEAGALRRQRSGNNWGEMVFGSSDFAMRWRFEWNSLETTD